MVLCEQDVEVSRFMLCCMDEIYFGGAERNSSNFVLLARGLMCS